MLPIIAINNNNNNSIKNYHLFAHEYRTGTTHLGQGHLWWCNS